MPKTVSTILIGKMLGDCRIEQILGEGGMGTVYLALQTSLDRRVAVKVLASRLLDDAEYLARFEREAKIIAQLNHPNIVQIYSIGRDRKRPFIVMEFVEGRTLAQILDRDGRLGVHRTCSIALQVAQALEAAWARGIVHRDIKPDNILVTDEGAVKVMDFGIARSISQQQLTHEIEVLGSAHYMSPESCRGEPVDVRSDLYSLGLVMWHCLAGRAPFEGATDMSIMLQQVQDPMPDLRARNPNVPAEVCGLIESLTRKRAADRPAAPCEAISAIREYFERHTASPVALARERETSHEILADIVESSDDAIVALTPDGIIASWNAGAQRVYGYAASEIVGRSALSLLPPERMRDLEPMLQRLRGGDRVERCETAHVRQDGSRIGVSVTFSPIRGSSGILGVSMIARDITDRLRAEEELRASERKFRALAEAATDAIISTDATGQILYMNAAAERIFGWSASEARRRSLATLFAEAFREAADRGMREYLETGRSGLIGQSARAVARRKDGSEFPAEVSIGSWRSLEGTFFTAIVRDRSEG